MNEEFDPRNVTRWEVHNSGNIDTAGDGDWIFASDYFALLKMWEADRRELEHAQAYEKRLRAAFASFVTHNSDRDTPSDDQVAAIILEWVGEQP